MGQLERGDFMKYAPVRFLLMLIPCLRVSSQCLLQFSRRVTLFVSLVEVASIVLAYLEMRSFYKSYTSLVS